jgi:hypothetical protein
MTGDKFARVLTGLAVLAVAVIAAIVSFSHIEALALAHGQPLVAARLLPLSVDGLLVASSLTLLAEARARRDAPAMARTGLVLGVIATVLANVAFGARFGIVGAVISAWPAVSFIVATEIIVGQMRRAGATPAPEAVSATVSGVRADVTENVPVDIPVNAPAGVPPSTLHTAPVRRAPTVSAARARRAPVSKPKAAERVFAAELAAGTLPSVRSIKTTLRVGTPRAQEIRDSLAAILEAPEAA